MDELLLGSSESSLVGDIENAVVGLSVLSVNTSDLHVVLVGDLLELGHVLHEFRELDVDGGSQSGTEVGWAGGDVSEVLVVGERAHSLDVGGSVAEPLEDTQDVGTWLHGDDSELILLIDPHEEGLGVVVEDTSAGWPVSVETAGGEILVSLPMKFKFKVRLMVQKRVTRRGSVRVLT